MLDILNPNLMKLGGSLGNVPQKIEKKTCNKSSIQFGLLMRFHENNFENGLSIANI
jgi:hypothetical protein